MALSQHFKFESASAKLVKWDRTHATMSNVFSMVRGEGHGTGVVQMACDYADLHGLVLDIYVQAYHYADGLSPDNAELRKWYAKFGFVENTRFQMTRQPVTREIQAS